LFGSSFWVAGQCSPLKSMTVKTFGAAIPSSLPDSAGTNQEKSFNIMKLLIDCVGRCPRGCADAYPPMQRSSEWLTEAKNSDYHWRKSCPPLPVPPDWTPGRGGFPPCRLKTGGSPRYRSFHLIRYEKQPVTEARIWSASDIPSCLCVRR